MRWRRCRSSARGGVVTTWPLIQGIKPGCSPCRRAVLPARAAPARIRPNARCAPPGGSRVVRPSTKTRCARTLRGARAKARRPPRPRPRRARRAARRSAWLAHDASSSVARAARAVPRQHEVVRHDETRRPRAPGTGTSTGLPPGAKPKRPRATRSTHGHAAASGLYAAHAERRLSRSWLHVDDDPRTVARPLARDRAPGVPRRASGASRRAVVPWNVTSSGWSSRCREQGARDLRERQHDAGRGGVPERRRRDERRPAAELRELAGWSQSEARRHEEQVVGSGTPPTAAQCARPPAP